ncbi:HGGxSTG domain-containing protein [Bacillus sp. Bos-x628]|uniref:HGGxSTG domain-containing protein n=1 Tax=Bacillus maqinnsis TaxID=3229854 RepID=UPI00338FCC1C
MDFKKDMSFCGALAKNNTICTAVPHMKEDGSTNGRCQKHGRKSTGAKTEEGKKRSLAQLKRRTPVHWLTTERLWNELTNEEKDYLEWFEESVKEQFVIENAIEETSLRMMAFEAVKHFRMINTQPFKETITGMQMVQKFLRFFEVQGWRRRDLDEEQRKGVSVDTMMKLLNELDEEKKPSSQNNIKSH